MMEEPSDYPPMDPRVGACFGFVAAAVAGSLASVAWMYWKQMDEIFRGMPSQMRSGGTAFSVNLPGMAVEFPAYFFGVVAFLALGATLLWSPRTLRSWYSVAGIICLLPVFALGAARMGWLHG